MKTPVLCLCMSLLLLLNAKSQIGSPDLAYGTNGIVKADLSVQIPYSSQLVKGLVAPDGSVYAVMAYSGGASVLKLNPDGTPDLAYGNSGYSVTVGSINASDGDASLLPDGRVVIAGYFINSQSGEYDSRMARLTASGNFDSTFGGDGNVTIYSEFVGALDISTDGSIVVAGNENSGLQQTIHTYKILSNGSIDNSFNEYRVAFESYAYELKILSDGKILVGGMTGINFSDIVLLQFNTDGTLDNSFDGDGLLITSTPARSDFQSLAVDNTGKIIIGIQAGIYRYLPDGMPDLSFNGNGILPVSFQAKSISIAADNKIYAAGSVNNDLFIQKFNTDGSADNFFSGDSRQSVNLDDDEIITNTAVDADGHVYLFGSRFDHYDPAITGYVEIARFLDNGNLDVSFNTSGTLKDLYKAKGATIFLDAALQTDKKVIAAGQVWNGSNYDFVLARYLDNGVPDASFGTGGYTTLDFDNQSDTATSIVILDDGKILVAGSTAGKFALARFKQDGSPDITFNSNGYRVYSFDASVARTIKIKVQDDGKIDALAGHTLARFASDGNLDVSFDGDGQVYVDLAVSGDLAIQADGKIIVSGRTSYMAAIRYRPDGSIDTDFSGGKVQYLFTDYDEEIGAVASSILIQPDGKILLGGHTRFYNFARQPNHWAIARLNTDGTLDNTFNGKGTNYYSNYADEYVTSMALQDDGRIILGGYSNGASTQTPGIYNFQLRRLTADGQPDNTFGNSGTVLSPVGNGDSRNYKILISGDRILAVGQAQFANTVGVIVAYKLTDQPAATPSITLSTPYDIMKYSSPARIKLNAVVNDAAAAIKKVRFYSGTTLLHTETKAPYGFLWDNVATGDYTLTAKAYDENDQVITSNEIHVTVIDENVAPYVSMNKPSMDTSYTGPADIRLIANAKDPNGRITKLDFFVGNTLLFSQKYYPYTYTWRNVQPGTYVVTAVATDNEGLSTTSAPVIMTVTNANLPTVGSPFPANGSDAPGGLFSFKLSPNPVANMLTVSIEGLQDKTGQLTLLNFSGAVLKHYNTGSDKRVQIDVSSLAKGMYILKYTSGEKVTYKRFIKM